MLRRTRPFVSTPPESVDPAEITTRLGVEPDSTHRRGELRPARSRRDLRRLWRNSGWFLGSETVIASRDERRHIDWLLDRLADKALVLSELRAAGCETVISCYWESAIGHGGPALWPEQMARLAEAGLEIWFDVYFPDRSGPGPAER